MEDKGRVLAAGQAGGASVPFLRGHPIERRKEMAKAKEPPKITGGKPSDPLREAARRVTRRCEEQVQALRRQEANFVEQASRRSLNFVITR